MICDTYSDFNGDSGVHAVLVVQIDTVHVQPLQAALTRSSHVLWIASYRKPALLIDDVGKLCCQLYLIPNPLNRLQKHTFSETPESYCPNAVGELNGTDLSDKDLVSVRSIHISSIQECDASVHSVPNEIDHLLLGPRRSIEGMQPRPCCETSSPCDPSFTLGTMDAIATPFDQSVRHPQAPSRLQRVLESKCVFEEEFCWLERQLHCIVLRAMESKERA